ncbi:MAG: hypothetical protein R2809_15340, partial [Flavobacteriales bacterium]
MESQSFYYDEQHSRTIKLEWTKDCGQVTIYDNDQILHQHSDVGQLKKGIVIRTQKGENLYIRLFMEPVRWQVSFGDRMLINSYNRSEEVVKGTSQIFYYVFLASVIYLMLLFLPQYKAGMIGLDILLTPTMLIYIGLIVVFYLCGMLVRRGKLTWYYIGTSLYLIDTVYVLLNSFVISEISISALFQTNLGLILFAL